MPNNGQAAFLYLLDLLPGKHGLQGNWGRKKHTGVFLDGLHLFYLCHIIPEPNHKTNLTESEAGNSLSQWGRELQEYLLNQTASDKGCKMENG